MLPAVPKFCPQPPEDPVLSHRAHGSVLSCPKILFLAVSRFCFPIQAIPRFCPQLCQGPVVSGYVTFFLSFFFLHPLSQQPIFVPDSTPAVQCILTPGSCGPWVTAFWALTSSGSSEKTGNSGWHLSLAEEALCQAFKRLSLEGWGHGPRGLRRGPSCAKVSLPTSFLCIHVARENSELTEVTLIALLLPVFGNARQDLEDGAGGWEWLVLEHMVSTSLGLSVSSAPLLYRSGHP